MRISFDDESLSQAKTRPHLRGGGATEAVAGGSPTEAELEGEHARPSESLIGEAQASEPQHTSKASSLECEKE